MFTHAILEFPGKKDKVEVEDISKYDGEDDPTQIISLETVVDTTELTLSFLGEMFPRLEKLRLNNSIMTSVRDIGCTLKNLRFLNLARCGLTSLDGLGGLSGNLEELYVAYNKITDVCDLIGMEKLKIVDLEANLLTDINQMEILKTAPNITALTLAHNPMSECDDYREKIAELIPSLIYLDEKRIKRRSIKTPRSEERTVKFEEKVIGKPPPENINLSTEILMTEQVRDKIEDAPISTRGSDKGKEFASFFKITQKVSKSVLGKNINKSRIIRPVSAKGRAYF